MRNQLRSSGENVLISFFSETWLRRPTNGKHVKHGKFAHLKYLLRRDWTRLSYEPSSYEIRSHFEVLRCCPNVHLNYVTSFINFQSHKRSRDSSAGTRTPCLYIGSVAGYLIWYLQYCFRIWNHNITEKDQMYWLSSQEQIVDCGISFDHPGKVSSFPYNNQ